MLRKLNYAFLFVLISLYGCKNPFTENKVFESDKLKGKYKMQLGAFFSEELGKKSKTKEDENLANGMGLLAENLGSMHCIFYENEKGVIHTSFLGKEEIMPFVYTITNDSIISLFKIEKGKKTEFVKKAILTKYSDKYDFIELKLMTDNEPLRIKFTKVQE